MPSGYTADIANDISFEKFVMGCARNFGTCISMRDEPLSTQIPDEFKPSPYHSEELEKAKTNLEEIKNLTIKEAEIKSYNSYMIEIQNYERIISEKRELESKYIKMLEQVDKWQPPTPEHNALKTFMIEEITQSIDFDCNLSYTKKPKLFSSHEWLEQQINNCLRNIEYHSKELIKEEDIYSKRTEWIKALRKSLSIGESNE